MQRKIKEQSNGFRCIQPQTSHEFLGYSHFLQIDIDLRNSLQFTQQLATQIQAGEIVMYSLSDLEQNLKSLLTELSQVQKSISAPQRLKAKNAQSQLLRIPRALLLLSICRYLSMEDINGLSMVCSDLRKKVYSPMGWKIISRLKTVYPLQVVNVKSDLNTRIKRVALENTVEAGLDDFDDEKFISQERSKYKSKLLSKYTAYLQTKERYEACQDKLRSEKAQLFKLKQQIGYLAAVKRELNDQNTVNKERLKSLSDGFSLKIQNMDQLNDSLMKERTKLQNQKQALASKVREYQNEIQAIRQDSEKSKQILKRLKNYLLYKEL